MQTHVSIRYAPEGGTVITVDGKDITSAVLSAPITIEPLSPGGPFGVTLTLASDVLDVDVPDAFLTVVKPS